MKRKYMMVCGFICLVFAYANVLAGKMVFGYLCGMSSLLIGLFLLYVYGIFELKVQHVLMNLPFVGVCCLLMKMPYEVATSLAYVGFMTIGYSVMVQMLWKDLRVKECKYLSKYMVGVGLAVGVVWLVSLLFVTSNFEWVLVGNDWMLGLPALQIELLSMVVLLGAFLIQGVYSLMALSHRVLMNSY